MGIVKMLVKNQTFQEKTVLLSFCYLIGPNLFWLLEKIQIWSFPRSHSHWILVEKMKETLMLLHLKNVEVWRNSGIFKNDKSFFLLNIEQNHWYKIASYPDVFLYCWISMGAQILSPNFFEQHLQRDFSETNVIVRALQFHSSISQIYVPVC